MPRQLISHGLSKVVTWMDYYGLLKLGSSEKNDSIAVAAIIYNGCVNYINIV